MSGIFISYRRQDSAAYAGRLYDVLLNRYGRNVFLDLETLAPGTDWAAQRFEAIKSCDAVLVIIGDEWLSATDANGERRLHARDDFVRSEIATALRLGKPLVPVLVGGASMPPPSELPPNVVDLSKYQACVLRQETWSRDVEQLFKAFDPLMAKEGSSLPLIRRARELEPTRGGTFLSRLTQAFDLLVGRRSNQVASPERSPLELQETAVLQSSKEVRAFNPKAHVAEDRKHEIFVSYSTEDLSVAENIVSSLEAGGRRCWIAHRDIPPGVPSWAEPIVNAISHSRLLIVLLTQHSVSSIEVLREVTLAADEKIPLLPVSLDASPLSPALRYFFVAGQRLDLTRYSPGDQIQKIAPAVDRQLGTSRL